MDGSAPEKGVQSNIIQPGKDHEDHDSRKLHGPIAQAMNLPVKEVVPVGSQVPQVSGLAGLMQSIDPDNIKGDITANSPFNNSTVRVASNMGKKGNGFFGEWKERLRKQHPDSNIEEVA